MLEVLWLSGSPLFLFYSSFRGVRYNFLARRDKSVLERRPSGPEKVAGKGEVVRLPPRIGWTSEVSLSTSYRHGIVEEAATPKKTIDRHQASSYQHDEFYVLDVTHWLISSKQFLMWWFVLLLMVSSSTRAEGKTTVRHSGQYLECCRGDCRMLGDPEVDFDY